jgi:MFS family permease
MEHDDYESISFLQALLVPGVLEYSACLFFSKLVAYAFTFWLPKYLSNLNYSDTQSGNLSTVYDMGGVAGGVLAGYASDWTGKRGLVSVTMLLLSLPGLWVYSFLAGYGLALNITLMFLVGILVNGPYTLISGVVAADLGSHPSLKGNPKAMSTVTGIIDGAGSVGAALQGVVIGLAGQKIGWTNVFYLLEGFCFLAAMCLMRILFREVEDWRRNRRNGTKGGKHERLEYEEQDDAGAADAQPSGGASRRLHGDDSHSSSPEEQLFLDKSGGGTVGSGGSGAGDVRLKGRKRRTSDDESIKLIPSPRASDLKEQLI